MEILNINNRDKIINSYGLTPTLPYDIEGVLVEKNGKDIKVEKTIDNKVIEYSLRLKQEIVHGLGDNIKVEKENIVSAKLEEKEEKVKSEEESRRVSDILMELGLEHTEENIRMVEFLLKNGIRITKENVDSYKKSREYLNKIVEGIDSNSYIKLMNKGIDLEEESLQKIAEALEDIKNERPPFSLRKFLKLEKDLTYKEAEEVAKEIYGQRMGKDVYDTIIALHKEKLPITKENIEKVMETMSKLHNLKEVKSESYVRIIKEDIDFNIENLYKINNSYTLTNIEENLTAKTFEEFTVEKEVDINGLREILANLDIEDTRENIYILREFIVNDMTMDKEKYEKIISMKEAVEELIELLKPMEISALSKKGFNPLEEDIHQILNELKGEDIIEPKEEPLKDEEAAEIMRGLEILGSIKDKELLQLVKSGLDFNIRTIKEIIKTDMESDIIIDNKTFNKTIHFHNIFNSLGGNLQPETVSLVSRRYDFISLENLYNVQRELDIREEVVSPVDKVEEGLIFQEYIKARNSLTVNIIKESIEEGKALEHMAMSELNEYIGKKINRYEESNRTLREIKNIKGKEDRLIPIIMKNNLSMNLKEIKDINSTLNGEKNITNILKNILNPNNLDYSEEYKEEIKLLQEKISQSIKNGDAELKKSYDELMGSLGSSDNTFDTNERNREKKEYIEIVDKISRKDMVIQLPVQIGGEYRSLNLIVPNANKGIDKNNMSFYISLDTDNIGMVNMEIHVKGREVNIHIEEEGTALSNNASTLKKALDNLGYTVNIENRWAGL